MKAIIKHLHNENSLQTIVDLIARNRTLYEQINPNNAPQVTRQLQDMFVAECVKANQYIRIGAERLEHIHMLYGAHLARIQALLPERFNRENIRLAVQQHRATLITLLEASSDSSGQELLVPCAEYSAAFQAAILRLEGQVLPEPILDLGCGKARQLLHLLRDWGYHDLWGIDQYAGDGATILCADWLSYDFETDRWGTIMSHMAFSNHCRNALATGTLVERYRAKFLEILDALQPGGRWIYTPRVLPFEQLIDRACFELEIFRNTDDHELDTVWIKKKR